MKKLFSLLTVFVMTVSLVGCGISPIDNANPTKIVKIGVILSLSGPASSWGADGLNAYTYEVEKFNATHTGIQIQLVVEDGKCEGKDATSAAQKLITVDKVQAIVAGYCSAEAIAAGKIAQDNGVFFISPGASSSEISDIGEYVFKLFDNRFMSEAFAEYLTKHEVSKVVAFAENTAYTVDIINSLTQHYTGQIERVMFQSDEKDFLTATKQLKTKLNENTVLLFLPTSDASAIAGIKAMEKEGILEMMKGSIIGGEIIGGVGIYEAMGSALNGIKLAQLKNLENFPEIGQTIAEYFKTHYTIQSDVLWFILGAEVMDLTLEAIEQVGNNAEAIKEYITALSPENAKQGYFGDYYFTPERNAEGLGFLIYEIQEGALVAVS